MLTGHGCFGEYLHRIGKEATARCHYCDASMDSAQHTLEYCPAWAQSRRDFIAEIGWDLSPPAILEALLVSDRGRRAVTSFCIGYASERGSGEDEGVELPPREDRPARARQRPWTRFDEVC